MTINHFRNLGRDPKIKATQVNIPDWEERTVIGKSMQRHEKNLLHKWLIPIPFNFTVIFYSNNTFDLSSYILKGNCLRRERQKGRGSKMPQADSTVIWASGTSPKVQSAMQSETTNCNSSTCLPAPASIILSAIHVSLIVLISHENILPI